MSTGFFGGVIIANELLKNGISFWTEMFLLLACIVALIALYKWSMLPQPKKTKRSTSKKVFVQKRKTPTGKEK